MLGESNHRYFQLMFIYMYVQEFGKQRKSNNGRKLLILKRIQHLYYHKYICEQLCHFGYVITLCIYIREKLSNIIAFLMGGNIFLCWIGCMLF